MTEPLVSLQFVRGGLAGECLPLPDGETILGRSLGADIVMFDLMVSRNHARFFSSGPLCEVCDLGSKGGTWVNARRIQEPTPLHPGDVVRCGNQEIKVADGCAARRGRRGAAGTSRRFSGAVLRTAVMAFFFLAGFVAGQWLSPDALVEIRELEPFSVSPDWQVDSAYVDLHRDGTTNEIVVIFKPAHGS